ncbi:MAG: Xaa-Pro peptidase family protein [Rhodospirillales bacterium]|jgi:Xaa-Pro dipeptidase|nr:Xaa-Pro peptidase family protein [Rhodospirillales bacterium]MDP6883117.1 Xaa-Pro peptidase family protein [Rhodospirillales bacterium]
MSADHLPFTLDEYAARLSACRDAMGRAKIDILLVSSPENINYLTGYYNIGNAMYQALLVPLDGDPRFVLRKLFFEGIGGVSWITTGVAVADTESMLEATLSEIAAMGAASARIGYDGADMHLPADIVDGLRTGLPKATLVGAGGIVEAGRVVKSAREIEYIRQACALSVRAMEAGIARIAPGVTENDIAGAMYHEMMKGGSGLVSNQPYIYAGIREPARRSSFEGTVLKAGDSIWFEGSASIQRYGGPIMRTFSVGKPPAVVQKTHDVMVRALDAILGAARPGAASGDVDRAGRRIVEQAGLGERWLHRTGYSVGVSFPPNWGEGYIFDLKPGDPRPLSPGMVFHTVPWVLLEDVGAIGLSETWRVTDDGVEVLTETPRKLRVA